MGVSTDGRICFGLLYEEGFDFPWDEDEKDIEDWWRDQHDWKPSKEVYDGDGNHLPGITKADIEAFYKEQRDWDEAHPLPVEVVNVCSGDCPIYMLAIPSTVKTANRGYPVIIDINTDFQFKEGERQAFLDFIQTHELQTEHVPAWYLSSEWH